MGSRAIDLRVWSGVRCPERIISARRGKGEMTGATSSDSSALPPMVLMVEDDPAQVAMYATLFESDGVWMARCWTDGSTTICVHATAAAVSIATIGSRASGSS
jgi:hypothetical protein